MSKYSSMLRQVVEAKPITGFSPNPKIGRHRVALKSFGPKETEKTNEVLMEVEFVVMQSETDQVGSTRSIPFFINSSGWPGKYSRSRMQQFALTLQESIQDDADFGTFLEEIVADEANALVHGVVLDVEVTAVPDKDDPTKQRTNAKGRPVVNAEWEVVTQTEDDIMAAREFIAKSDKNPPKAAPRETAAPAAPAPSGAGKLAGARRLLGGSRS